MLASSPPVDCSNCPNNVLKYLLSFWMWNTKFYINVSCPAEILMFGNLMYRKKSSPPSESQLVAKFLSRPITVRNTDEVTWRNKGFEIWPSDMLPLRVQLTLKEYQESLLKSFKLFSNKKSRNVSSEGLAFPRRTKMIGHLNRKKYWVLYYLLKH